MNCTLRTDDLAPELQVSGNRIYAQHGLEAEIMGFGVNSDMLL
jgi:hypothetical protein